MCVLSCKLLTYPREQKILKLKGLHFPIFKKIPSNNLKIWQHTTVKSGAQRFYFK